jgi:hypothetical protein
LCKIPPKAFIVDTHVAKIKNNIKPLTRRAMRIDENKIEVYDSEIKKITDRHITTG